jgi:protein-disulfide isomerase
MLKKLSLAVCGLALGLTLATYSGKASDGAFDETQREELHQIIRDYLISNPNVIRDALEALQLQQEAEEVARLQENIRENATDLFHMDGDFVLGNPDGNVTMVEFFDYNCGYCRRSLDDVLTLIDTDPELKLVLKEFPILGEGSLFAARAALASIKQDKYWEFHVAIMQSPGSVDEVAVLRVAGDIGLDLEQLRADMEDVSVDTLLQQNYALAELVGIQGTPAFVIDDRLIPGALGVEGLRTEIAEVRASGTCLAC